MRKAVIQVIGILMVLWGTASYGQPRPDQNANGTNVSNTNSNTIGGTGGSAPIGGGLAILMAMGALYAGNKYLKYSKEQKKMHE